MKNIAHLGVDKIECLDFQKRIDKWRTGYRNYYGPGNIFERNPYFAARKIIENNIGKSFDLAFSYFCKKFSLKDQHIFLKKFDKYWDKYSYYYIDENGCIQYSEYYKKKFLSKKDVIFKSNDLKTELIHKESKIPKSKFNTDYLITGTKTITYQRKNPATGKFVEYSREEPIKKKIGYIFDGIFNKISKDKVIKAQDEDFIEVVVNGEMIKFDSKRNRNFIKKQIEKQKELKKQRRLKNNSDIQDWDFILKKGTEKLELKELSEQELKNKEKLDNEIKILAHGFDLQTSFRTPQKFTNE